MNLHAFRSATDSNTGVFSKYWETIKNTYFEEHLRTAAPAN